MEDYTGQSVKGYTLTERIGAGGFGAVYLAQQSNVDREVAVKIILPHFTSQPEFIRRFEQEAQLIARLEHLHIVPLYDYWRDPDGAYLIMRRMRGGSLRDALNDGPFDPSSCALLIDQISMALSFAHQNQVIHRDLKPENILMDEDGNAYLADFGIAKDLTNTQANATSPNAVVGSLDYLSPEQARGEPVTACTDIYSLGVVVYEILEGKHPFDGFSSIERLYKHISDPIPYVASLEDHMGADINKVIQKATQKDPAQRYTDVLEFATALRKSLHLNSIDLQLEATLTLREQEVLQCLIDGLSNSEIADKLFIAIGTVKWYNTVIYQKLGVRSRVQAVVKARELNLIGQTNDDEFPSVATIISSLSEPINPYKGLHAFYTSDAQDFFGRDEFIQKLTDRMQDNDPLQRFLTVIGPSGSGKSSVVKAGLIPALRKGAVADSDKWFVIDMLPGSHPLDKLETALMRVAANHTQNLHEQLQRDERGLLRVADLILPSDNTQLVIVVDQFEEVFTLVEDEETRQRFLDLLRVAVSDTRSRVRVIITLRADYYDRPLHYPEFGELIRSRMETILPLTAKGLERAIRGPSERVGVIFEQGLVEQIVSTMNYQSGALPLLQFALTELFERRNGRILTNEAYVEVGGAVGALANRADEIYLSLSEEGQQFAQQMLMRLVTLGEGAEDTRRRVPQLELLSLTKNVELMEEVIDQFAAYRLLSLDHDPKTRQPTVEVAHEAILREWDRLRSWLNYSREDIRQEQALARAAQDWETQRRDSSYLLRGSRLEQMEKWQVTTNLILTPLERNYIAKSLQQRETERQSEIVRQQREAGLERRSRNFLRSLVTVFAVATLVTGGLALYAFNQRNSAVSAEQEALIQASIGLASQARLDVVEGVPERAVPVALEAIENYPYTWQAERALFSSVTENRILLRLDSHSGSVNRVVWSPDQSLLASVSDDETAIIWNAVSGEIIHVMEGHDGRVRDVAWSPNGHRLATADETGRAIIWDADTGTLSFDIHHEVRINTIEWSPDGALIATASDDQSARIWNAETGDEMFVLLGHTDEVWEVLWSPDGSMLATTSRDGRVQIWDAGNGEETQVLDGGANFVFDAEWSPDGAKIVTADGSNMTRIWDASTGEELVSFEGEGRGAIQITTWSPSGAQILTVENGANLIDGVGAIWDAVTGERIYRLPGKNDLNGGAWSPDGSRVAVTDESEVIRIWNTTTGELLDTLRRPGNFTGSEISVQWSSDGNQIAVHSESGIVTIFDATESALITIRGQNSSASWSPDGSAYLRSDLNGNLIVVDTETNETVMMLPAEHVAGERWSPDGRYILSSGNNRVVHVIDALTGENLYDVEGNGQMSWSPNSTQFSVADYDNAVVYVYDRASGNRLFTLSVPDSYFICEVEWSRDGTRIAGGILGQNSTLKIWDAESGEELLSFEPGGFGCNIDWSPDGTRLVVPGDQVAYVLDPETGETLLTFGGHTGFVNGAEYSPDGSRIVTAGDEATRIWDATTGAEYGVLDVQDWQAHWSPDGSRILTIGPSGVLRIWRVWQSTEDLIEYAYDCCFFRELLPEERVQFGLLNRE